MSHSYDDGLELVGADKDIVPLSPHFHSLIHDDRSPTAFSDLSAPTQPSTQLSLDSHEFESAHPQPIHLNNATSDTKRPKQTMVAPKKRRSAKKSGRQGGRGGRDNVTSRATKSATPAPTVPKLTLKLRTIKAENENLPNTNNLPDIPDVASSPAPPQDEPSEREDEPADDDNDDESHISTEPVATSRRSGRQIKKPQKDADFVMGSEMDQALDLSSISKADDDGDYGPNIRSSPPYNGTNNLQIFELQSKPRLGRPRKVKNAHSSLPMIEEDLSSDTIAPLTPRPDRQGSSFMSNVTTDVSGILDSLRSYSTVLIDLPPLSHKESPDQDVPYSAKILVQLYLLCYQSKLWNLCDLIADTWIRAFHALRRQGQQKPELQTWRPNGPLEKRQKEADVEAAALDKARKARNSKKKTRVRAVGFEENAPDYKLDVMDPELENNVTSFDSTFLYELYDKTDEKCGARFLWADAMALGGSKMEDLLARSLRRQDSWHPELFVNIMFASLRMVRRKLTLKIEEELEGAWCKRYHEHSKHGLPCYRELAWREKEERLASEHAARTLNRSAGEGDNQVGTLNGNEQDIVYGDGEQMSLEMDQDELAAQIMEELGRGEKREFEDVDEGEMSAHKRQMHWGVDVDAEGESEEN